MATMIIVGQKGTGKTALATKIALENLDKEVYSNYRIESENYHKLDFSILPELSNPHIIIFDEAYMYLDARGSGTNKIGTDLTHLLFQSRKRKADYILTLQIDSSLDLRFRGLADVYIMSELINPIYDENDELIDCNFRYHVFKNERYLGAWDMTFQYAQEHIFGKYDTEQLINTSRDIGKELTLVEPETEEIGIQNILGEIYKTGIPLQKWTKAMIKAKIMELRYPIIYTDKVYGRKQIITLQEEYDKS